MKKLLGIGIALALMWILAMPALADVQYDGPVPLYVNLPEINVYTEQDLESEVIVKLKGAASVLPEVVSDDGLWIGILVEDAAQGGQKIGWVPAENLTDEFPASLCQHEWGEWTVEREATCAEVGYSWRLCAICGLRRKRDREEGPRLEQMAGDPGGDLRQEGGADAHLQGVRRQGDGGILRRA